MTQDPGRSPSGRDTSEIHYRKLGGAKDAIESILEAFKKAIPESIDKLRVHKKLTRNYLDMYERALLSPKGSSEAAGTFYHFFSI